jgi:hypothetical protein
VANPTDEQILQYAKAKVDPPKKNPAVEKRELLEKYDALKKQHAQMVQSFKDAGTDKKAQRGPLGVLKENLADRIKTVKRLRALGEKVNDEFVK